MTETGVEAHNYKAEYEKQKRRLREELENWERTNLTVLYVSHGRNFTRMADAMLLDHSNLRRRFRQLGIPTVKNPEGKRPQVTRDKNSNAYSWFKKSLGDE